MIENADELAAIPGLLAKLRPGFLPPTVFDSIARLIVTPTFVVVPLLCCGDKTLVHLPRRETNDRHYANLLNLPGTVILASDNNLADTFRRLAQTEMPGLGFHGAPVFVDIFYQQIARGREISLVHWVALAADTDRESLYDTTALPTDLVATDITRLDKAVHHFRCRDVGEPTDQSHGQ